MTQVCGCILYGLNDINVSVVKNFIKDIKIELDNFELVIKYDQRRPEEETGLSVVDQLYVSQDKRYRSDVCVSDFYKFCCKIDRLIKALGADPSNDYFVIMLEERPTVIKFSEDLPKIICK
jgi:hypothetical protein